METLELIVALALIIAFAGVIGRRLRIPDPVLLLVLGVLAGLVPAVSQVHLPPEIMLLVFLPPLLYWEAINSSVRSIRQNFRGILLASTLLVVATAAAVAVVGHSLGLEWGPAWVLGAALAPTDATAVAALSRLLPRKNMATLKAEGLVNDGTALVVYGVAVGVTVGEETLSVSHLAWLVLLSYGGGILVGVACALLWRAMRRRITDPWTTNTLILALPLSAYLVAEWIHASGVLAVVVAGLMMSQAGPRISQPISRQITTGFWSFATYLLNAALFVLIGIEAVSAARTLEPALVFQAVLMVVLIWVTLVVVRFAFLVISAYTIRLLDRRPSQRSRRLSNRSRVVSTVAGFRGAVSLALVLSVPTSVGSGGAFPQRDLIICVAAGVVACTLIIQSILLAPTVRWARLPDDNAHEREWDLVARRSAKASLKELPALGEKYKAPANVLERVRREHLEVLDVLNERGQASQEPEHDAGDGSGTAIAGEHDLYTLIRLDLITLKRQLAVGMRDAQEIDDSVLRQVQGRLDLEEVRLTKGSFVED